jgi:hypothetical protein
MVRRSVQREGPADSDITEFLTAFARYLVESGVTSSRFSRMMRIAFYRAASLDARFSNNRLNRSAVAVMTGLTRAQVRDLSKEKKTTTNTKSDRIENIIEGWATDPDFTTAGYLPKRLRFGRKGSNFNALVRKFGGDIPARSILREMVRTKCAKVEGSYVSLTSKARSTRGQSRLQHLCRSLTKLLGDSDRRHSSIYPLRVVNGEIKYPATSAKGRILMQRKSDKSIRALLEDLQAAGVAASLESPPSQGQKTWVTRTRVVLISEEIENGGVKSNSGD